MMAGNPAGKGFREVWARQHNPMPPYGSLDSLRMCLMWRFA